MLFSGLEPAGQAQLGLFSAPVADQQRRQQLMTTLDALNTRYGRPLVQRAAAGVARSAAGKPLAPVWAARAAHRSPRYTTGWDELWTV